MGTDWQGDTAEVVERLARVVESDHSGGDRPHAYIIGGETTVRLATPHGLGGRNQQFVLALAARLGQQGVADKVLLSAGTDGEDGPTDAAGAFADAGTLERAEALGLRPQDFLRRNDAYHFFRATGDLFVGFTELFRVRRSILSLPSGEKFERGGINGAHWGRRRALGLNC